MRPAASTTKRSWASARTRSSSRSTAWATRPSRPRRRCASGPATTGSSSTTATGPWPTAWAIRAKEMFLGSVGSVDDPASGGRQMPSHWGHQGLNIFTTSSPTGSQFLQAVGAAEAVLRAEQGGLQELLGIAFRPGGPDHHGRRDLQPGRVLGSRQQCREPESAGGLPGGGQRLRHQHPQRGAVPRRQRRGPPQGLRGARSADPG